MVKRWYPFVLGMLTFILAVSVKNDFAFFLFGFEVMLYLASVLQVLWLSRHVKLSVDLPERCVYKGKSFQIRARLHNESVFPVPQLLARVAIRVYPQREELLMRGKLMLDSREEGSLCFAMDSSHCQCLELRPDQLMITDFLGIVQKKCPVDRQTISTLFILPESLNREVNLPDVKGAVLLETGEEDGKGNSVIDVSEIRNYLPGDSLKLVHWKLSARLGELMVRELSDPVHPMTWIYLNLQEKPDQEAVRSNPDAWDVFLESVSMVSTELLKQGKPHAVIWIQADNNAVARFEVVDPPSLEEMLCALLRADTYNSRDHTQLLKEIYTDETKGSCIEIDLQGHLIRSEGPG